MFLYCFEMEKYRAKVLFDHLETAHAFDKDVQKRGGGEIGSIVKTRL